MCRLKYMSVRNHVDGLVHIEALFATEILIKGVFAPLEVLSAKVTENNMDGTAVTGKDNLTLLHELDFVAIAHNQKFFVPSGSRRLHIE